MKLLLILLALGVGVAVWWSCKSCHPPKPPHLPLDEWWGPSEMRNRVDNSIRPFQIKFEETMIKDLKDRLKKHRPFTAPLEGAGFSYGFNQAQLGGWVSYWADQYPFAEREKFLNKYPQFKTNIQGLDIHFIRVRPQMSGSVQVVPLLLMHGWPGSVREFYEAIPLLTRQAPGYDFAFEVIVPSLPGYGFSDAAVRPGLGAFKVSVIMRNLMHRLGFKKYYVQGGDWGAAIASGMATLFPDEVLGHHSNMLVSQHKCSMIQWILGSIFPSFVVEPHLADRMYPLTKYLGYFLEEFGYLHLQSTKPDTIGVALTDSPAGLLAYILEKFSTWTSIDFKNLEDGGLSKKFSKVQLIDNLMVYWTSNSITTSMRLYAETMNKEHMGLDFDKKKFGKHGHRGHGHSHKPEHHEGSDHNPEHQEAPGHKPRHHHLRGPKYHYDPCIPTATPTWALQAKNELFYQSPTLLRKKYTNLVNTTVLDDGGHFLAFEMPREFAEDVFRAVKAFRELHKTKPKTEL